MVLITNDVPFETKIFLLLKSYLQKIFFGYCKIQLPFSILSFMFCSKLNDIFSIKLSLLIILFLIEAKLSFVKKKKILS